MHECGQCGGFVDARGVVHGRTCGRSRRGGAQDEDPRDGGFVTLVYRAWTISARCPRRRPRVKPRAPSQLAPSSFTMPGDAMADSNQ